jgi:hypothetical protein
VTPARLYRLGGLALLVALPCALLGEPLHPANHDPDQMLRPTWVLAHVLYLVGSVLALIGTPAMYARQAHRAGTFGLIAFVLAMLAGMAGADSFAFEAFGAPVLAANQITAPLVAPGGVLGLGPLGAAGGASGIGVLLFGITTLRARVFPRAAGILPIVGTAIGAAGVVFFPQVNHALPHPLWPVAVGTYLIFIGSAVAGWSLWRGSAVLHVRLADDRARVAGQRA